ncbi:DUF5616 domain-containing protein [Hyperthermus butylicus]|uniref:Conserved archaeal protein n=1 Tax=Hyperthermus butylicus (strain DSM 5456 / JCM 9403 / PLM1-5) TaxID=415426 RepID=A2BN66_HYPBU|nr:DUF5616 domain-containing protein [Hyperthermus butylicus]ABM81427.1 conserved archaeal protein [Hyperthermus butylicus DSM 5456]
MKGEKLVVDGFNQLTTVYAAYAGYPVYLCSDHLLRDALLAGPRYVVENISTIARLLAKALEILKPGETLVVLDSQPSWSGRTAQQLRALIPRATVILSRNADKTVIEYAGKGYIVASSDVAILERVDRIFDLARYIVENLLEGPASINNIPHLIEGQHSRWCREAGP